MSRVLFIVNPHAGTIRKAPVVESIERFSKNRFSCFEISFTTGPGHAKDLAGQAVHDGYDIVVACGGDGTVNEVASSLCKTDVKMGILPVGSGNGFARSLGISMNTDKALEMIADGQTRKVDMIKVADYTFVGLAGLGFDGMIAREFDLSPNRGLREYTRLVLSKFRNRSTFKCKISTDEGFSGTCNLLMLNVSSTGQYGNEVYISPCSIPDDGIFEVSMTRNFNSLQLLGFAWKVLRKRAHQSSFVTTLPARKMTVVHEEVPAHIDGEPVRLPLTATFEIVPKSLSVITPR